MHSHTNLIHLNISLCQQLKTADLEDDLKLPVISPHHDQYRWEITVL